MRIHRETETNRTLRPPSHGGSLAPSMVRNFKKLPKDLQKVATAAFSKFDYQTIESLRQTDLHITFARPELDSVAGGRFNPTHNTIELYVDPNATKHAEAYLIHEMVHAVDRLKHQDDSGLVRKLLTPAADGYASRHDSKLRRLHEEYAKRSLPGVGRQLADFARSQGEGQIHPGRRPELRLANRRQ